VRFTRHIFTQVFAFLNDVVCAFFRAPCVAKCDQHAACLPSLFVWNWAWLRGSGNLWGGDARAAIKEGESAANPGPRRVVACIPFNLHVIQHSLAVPWLSICKHKYMPIRIKTHTAQAEVHATCSTQIDRTSENTSLARGFRLSMPQPREKKNTI
jgi:hypothetical protein